MRCESKEMVKIGEVVVQFEYVFNSPNLRCEVSDMEKGAILENNKDSLLRSPVGLEWTMMRWVGIVGSF